MAPRTRRAAQALAVLPDSDPALAALALWCAIVDGPAETRTRGHTIEIGAAFTALPLREQIGLLGHHILHVALRHSPRMGAARAREGAGFSATLFNLAADALVNAVLAEAEHALPRPSVSLERLMQDIGAPEISGQLAAWDVERLYRLLTDLHEEGREKLDRYREESGFRPDLAAEREAAGAAGEDQTPGDWQGHLTRAMQAPGAAGRGIGAVLKRLGDLPRVETPWERHLRALVTKALTRAPHPSYRRPRRSWIAAEAEARRRGGPHPVFQPALVAEATRPRLVLALDTSGSVSDRQLARFASETATLVRRSGAETHLLCFDESVYDTRALAPAALVETLQRLPFRREGGTSFVEMLREASRIDPSVLVVLTDLDGPMGAPPPCPVIWAVPQPDPPKAPFGRVLSIAR